MHLQRHIAQCLVYIYRRVQICNFQSVLLLPLSLKLQQKNFFLNIQLDLMLADFKRAFVFIDAEILMMFHDVGHYNFQGLKDLLGVWLLLIRVFYECVDHWNQCQGYHTELTLLLFKAEIYYTENRLWAVNSSTASHNTEMENHCKQTDWERNEETQMGRDRRWDEKVAPTPVFNQAIKEKRNPCIHLHSSWYFWMCLA